MFDQTNGLDYNQLRQLVPSAFSTLPDISKVSSKYLFIPTARAMQIMNNDGWYVAKAAQSNSRTSDGKFYTKHLLRFRKEMAINNQFKKEFGLVPEILLTNAHNGQSVFKLNVGLFRFVCINGLVIMSEQFKELSIKHIGFKDYDIMEAVYSIINGLPRLFENVLKMKQIQLNTHEKYDYAKEASSYRWNSLNMPFSFDTLLAARRDEDKQNDLFSIYNVVEENLIKGGLRGYSYDDNNNFRRITTKPIQSIDRNIDIHSRLWQLNERYIQAKIV